MLGFLSPILNCWCICIHCPQCGSVTFVYPVSTLAHRYCLAYCIWALDEMAVQSVCQHGCCVKMEIWFVIYGGSISGDCFTCGATSFSLPHPGTCTWQFTLWQCDLILFDTCFIILTVHQTWRKNIVHTQRNHVQIWLINSVKLLFECKSTTGGRVCFSHLAFSRVCFSGVLFTTRYNSEHSLFLLVTKLTTFSLPKYCQQRRFAYHLLNRWQNYSCFDDGNVNEKIPVEV